MKRFVLMISLVLGLNAMLHAQTKVNFYTTEGDFVVYLEDTLMPITTSNFIAAVYDKFYDGVLFHRVIDGFMIQGGNGGPWPSIQDEFHPTLSNVKGTISMANRDTLDSGTSQFFINLEDNTRLDYDKFPPTSQHPVFGHVIEGFSVVQKIGKVPTSGNPFNKPITDVVMDSVRLIAPDPPVTSIYSNEHSARVKVFPNPANQQVLFRGDFDYPLQAEVWDLSGKRILSRQINSESDQLEVTPIEEGSYILILRSEQWMQRSKLLIVHH